MPDHDTPIVDNCYAQLADIDHTAKTTLNFTGPAPSPRRHDT